MPEEDNSILKYNQDKNSLKTSLVTNEYTEQLLEKIRTCDNNPEESNKQTKNKQTYMDIYYSYTVHSIAAEANMTFTEVLTV